MSLVRRDIALRIGWLELDDIGAASVRSSFVPHDVQNNAEESFTTPHFLQTAVDECCCPLILYGTKKKSRPELRDGFYIPLEFSLFLWLLFFRSTISFR